MQFISELKELVGKTIKSAEFTNDGDRFAVVFENDACIVIEVCYYGEYCRMEFKNSDEVDAASKLEAGIITKEQFLELDAIEKKVRNKLLRERELKQLARLREKYPGVYKAGNEDC